MVNVIKWLWSAVLAKTSPKIQVRLNFDGGWAGKLFDFLTVMAFEPSIGSFIDVYPYRLMHHLNYTEMDQLMQSHVQLEGMR